MAQPGSAFRSLRRKLLIPSLLLGATLACAGLFGISLARERSLVDGLHARAALIGNAIQYVVEGTSGASELQRIVSSMGTGDDIVDIVVVAGKPARVLATTQPSWIGKHLSELPGAEVAGGRCRGRHASARR